MSTTLKRNYEFKQNGDGSWNLRIWYGDDRMQNFAVHTNKVKRNLESMLTSRYPTTKTFV